jgi:hypothetical protein
MTRPDWERFGLVPKTVSERTFTLSVTTTGEAFDGDAIARILDLAREQVVTDLAGCALIDADGKSVGSWHVATTHDDETFGGAMEVQP